MLRVSAEFDSGNIEVLSAEAADAIRLAIRRDNNSEFFQWFYFRLTGAAGRDCVMRIENAAEAAYPPGWQDYRPFASYDRQHWFRVDATYDGRALTIRHRPGRNAVFYAYFVPYSMERHLDLIARCAGDDRVNPVVLGQTLDGQDLDLLEIGRPGRDKPKCWIIARQHPGESMGQWWMEGALDRLLDRDDPVSRTLLDKAVFYIVPNMNPDGSRRGHLRTNAAGVNLNRAWKDPGMDKSPEVCLVRQRMREAGCDFHLDVHGDEELPYNFIAGFEGIPNMREGQRALLDQYKAALLDISPDFQVDRGYPVEAPDESDLLKCTNWTAEEFGCLAMTLEMPFKDNADRPDPVHGWSPARSKHLARACLDALATVIDDL